MVEILYNQEKERYTVKCKDDDVDYDSFISIKKKSKRLKEIVGLTKEALNEIDSLGENYGTAI